MKTPTEWLAQAKQSRGIITDPLIRGLSKRFLTLAFKTPLPEWPRDKKVFGSHKGFGHPIQVRRLLFGMSVTLAEGLFLPAHVARLSDMAEFVFGKYRIQPARAKWNFSEACAKADCLVEEDIYLQLLAIEQRLYLIDAIPKPDEMDAIRALGGNRKHTPRRTDIKCLSDAIAERLESIEARLDGLEEYANSAAR